MDGIIFDVDGTLWDSTEAVARSWNQAIDENTDFSLSLTADGLKSLFGKTIFISSATASVDISKFF